VLISWNYAAEKNIEKYLNSFKEIFRGIETHAKMGNDQENEFEPLRTSTLAFFRRSKLFAKLIRRSKRP
jgi:hypothetical protein